MWNVLGLTKQSANDKLNEGQMACDDRGLNFEHNACHAYGDH